MSEPTTATGIWHLGDRFWSKVELFRGPAACWPWTGSTTDGYGTFFWQGASRQAHRLAYESLVGAIPEGLTLDHLCRNRACVNPAHLEPVTNAENILRGVSPSAEHARATHCPKGHEYTPENTYIRAGGRRGCRACHNANSREDRVCPECGERVARSSLTRHRQRFHAVDPCQEARADLARRIEAAVMDDGRQWGWVRAAVLAIVREEAAKP